MFGYVMPLKDELRVREFEQYKACYCALCHTLESDYGVFSRFILNYDFTFLAMLLWDEENPPSYQCARCIASPIRKKTYCASTNALRVCAGYSVILAWWKLRDSVADEHFFVSLRDRFLSLLLKRAYKKASKAYPDFEKVVKERLDDLRILESSSSDSLDACADKFAMITSALALNEANDEKRRSMEQMLYHMGRFIYIIDACDDLEEDIEKGRFNAIARRYANSTGKLVDEEKESLHVTLQHSCNLIGAAYELQKQNFWSPIIKNIVYLGMPEVCARVLNGTWHVRDNSRMNKGNEQIR